MKKKLVNFSIINLLKLEIKILVKSIKYHLNLNGQQNIGIH